jgi:hypothetical protein
MKNFSVHVISIIAAVAAPGFPSLASLAGDDTSGHALMICSLQVIALLSFPASRVFRGAGR